MDILEAIHTRRSIRKFTPEPVSPEDVETMLRAAMIAPTARNSQCWRFVVIDDRALLDAMPTLSPYTGAAKSAPLAILVCGDTTACPDFWPQDAAAAIQNLMLAARALELGSVWCGLHPVEEREKLFQKAFALPAHIRPLGLVILGHPDQPFTREDRYDPAKVRYNRWTS